jgi:hypothetical protein
LWLWLASSLTWFAYEGREYAVDKIPFTWWSLLDFGFFPAIGAAAVWRYSKAWGWQSGPSAIDPLLWPHQHQVGLIATSALGALAGLAVAFARAPGNSLPGAFFWPWLAEPRWYWPWVLMGAAVGVLGAYVARVLGRPQDASAPSSAPETREPPPEPLPAGWNEMTEAQRILSAKFIRDLKER